MFNTNFAQQCIEITTKLTRWHNLKEIQWKNKKPNSKEAYSPTEAEHIANVITHGIAIVPSFLATINLCSRSYNTAQFLSALLYGSTLVFLFIVSTCFHCVFYSHRKGQIKDVLHRCDRAMIYIFIAGSYFPWLTIPALPVDSWTNTMKWFVWFLAMLGIIYQQIFHEKFKMLETVFYLIMGICPAFVIISENDITGWFDLKIGGIFYLIGVLFFKSDGSIPCAHAIWHLFVIMAAGVHYYAILVHLYPDLPQTNNIIIKPTMY